MSKKATGITDKTRAPRPAAWTALACALIVAAGIAAYSNSFNGPFVFDDADSIVSNAAIRRLWPLGKFFWPLNRPVVNLTLAVNYAIGGLNVASYHAFNLVVHILAALTLYGLVRRTLTLPRLRARFGDAAIALALATALIWEVHPLQTESVTYIIQRAESLAGLFYLLTLYCVVRGALSCQPLRPFDGAQGAPSRSTPLTDMGLSNGKVERRWYAAAFAACVLGMGTKQTVATAPLVIFLYDGIFLSGSFLDALRRRWPLYLCLAATWGILGAVYPWGENASAGFGLASVGPWEYARTQPAVILHYLALSFWPRSLCLDYSWPIAATFRQIAPAATVVLLLLAGTVWALCRAPALGFLGAWFFLILAPTSSIVPIKDLAFEHRMYLPLAAVPAVVILAAYLAWGRLAGAGEGRHRLGQFLAAILVLSAAVALGCATFLRNEDYATAMSLWSDTVRKAPGNARALNNLGLEWNREGRQLQAIACFDKALKLSPTYATAYNNRALVLANMGRYELALRDYASAIKISPDYADAYINRCAAYVALGRYDEAIGDCERAMQLKPADSTPYNNRGGVHAAQGRYDLALADYDHALALDAEDAQAWYNRGLVHATLRRLDLAIGDYDRAIQLNPDFVEAHYARGQANFYAGHFAEAIRDYDAVIALKPDSAEAYNNRAIVRAQTGRYEEAARDWTQAIALKPDYTPAYYNRARIYFGMKKYAQALADIREFEKLGGHPDPGLVKSLTEAVRRAE